MTSKEYGDNKRSGVLINTRAQFNYKFENQLNAGLDMYSGYGSTSDLQGSNDQFHQLGPYISFGIPGKWSMMFGALFGLTDLTPDETLRLFMGKSF